MLLNFEIDIVDCLETVRSNVAFSAIFNRFFIVTFDWKGNFQNWWLHQKDLAQIYQIQSNLKKILLYPCKNQFLGEKMEKTEPIDQEFYSNKRNFWHFSNIMIFGYWITQKVMKLEIDNKHQKLCTLFTCNLYTF